MSLGQKILELQPKILKDNTCRYSKGRNLYLRLLFFGRGASINCGLNWDEINKDREKWEKLV